MNRIYRIIRSRSAARTVVVSEITKARGKSTAESVGLGRALRPAVLASLLAASVYASPVSFASTITDKSGASLIGSGTVHQLYAQDMTNSALTGRVGINRFTDFKVTSGDIANLHFNKQGESNHADRLVNLVNNKIDIAGTVNAVRDSRLDGHLYFLSPEGIAVGASGVVNAGKLTMIVPTKSFYEDLRDASLDDFREKFADSVMLGKNVNTNKKIQDLYSDDKDKGIVIAGRINTRSGMLLRAAKIDVKAGAKLLADRAIDFSSVVNTGGTVEAAGLSGVGMTLVQANDTTGDIVLVSEVQSYVDDFIVPSTFLPTHKITSREASITVSGAIESDGGVDIGASAESTFSQGSKFNLLEAVDFYDNFLGGLGLGFMADYAKKTNKTSITLDSTGTIVSGGKVIIHTKNTVSAKVVSNTPSKKSGETAGNALPVVSVGVALAENTSRIDIAGGITAGKDLSITAEASTKLSVKAKAATEPEEGLQPNHLFFSVGVLKHSTAAAIDVKANAGADTITSGGNIQIASLAKTDQKVTSTVEAVDGVTGVTTVAITNTDSVSSVNIDRNLTSAKATSITARTTISGDETGANNTLGEAKYAEKFKIKALQDPKVESLSKKAIDWILNLISRGTYGNNGAPAAPGGGAAGGAGAGAGAGNFVDTLLTNIGEYIRMGSSVAVNTSDNTASVTVGQGVHITTTNGNLTIGSELETEALHVSAVAESNLQSDEQQTSTLVAAAVAVTSIHNASTVLIGQDAVLTASGTHTEPAEEPGGQPTLSDASIEITATAKMHYNPVKAAIDSVADAWTGFLNALQAAGKDISSLSTISSKVDALAELDNSTDAFADKTEDYIKKIEELRETATADNYVMAIIDTLKDSVEVYDKLKGIWNKLMELIDPETYVNFYARSMINNTRHGTDSSKVDFGGNFSYVNYENKAGVALGQGASLTAKGKASVNSSADTQTVALSGAGGKYGTASESGQAGIGITALVQNIRSDSLVALGVNTSVEASSVAIDAETVMRQYAVVYAAGDADKFGLNGMVNVMNGDSSALATVNDSARLKGTGADGVKLDATNDTVVLGITGGLSLGSDSTVAAIGFGLTDINYDTNAIAAISDNVTEYAEGMALLTPEEQSAITAEAETYRESMVESITKEVDDDIKAGYIQQADRQGEIVRRLQNARSAKADELLLSRLAKKSEEDPSFAVALDKIMPGKILRSIGTFRSRPSFDDEGNVTDVQTSHFALGLHDGATTKQTGLVTAKKFDVTSSTTGSINAIAIEGSYVGSHAGFDKFNGFMKRSKASSFMDWLPKAPEAPMKYLTNKLKTKISDAINRPAAGGQAAPAAPASAPVDMSNPHGEPAASVNVAVAGSLGLVFADGQTLSLVDNTTVQAPEGNAVTMGVSSTDDLFAGTWAGSAAINWHNGAAGGGAASKSFSFGASLGLSSLHRKVDSVIHASTLTDVKSLTNEAVKKGTQVALGVGVAVSKGSGGGLEGSGAASVSSNFIQESVQALIVDTNVTGADSADDQTVVNTALAGDIQVAGGIDFAWSSGGDKGGAFGGAVTLSQVRNTLSSGIKGGTFTGVKNLDVAAVKATVEVNAAVAGAISTQETSIAFGGALTYANVQNASRSFITGANITASGTVSAHTDDTTTANRWTELLASKGVDYLGTSYLGSEGSSVVGSEKGGSKTVGVAIGFDYAKKGGVGAGVTVADLNENMLSEITSSTIETARLRTWADAKTTIFDLALGVSMGGENFNGAGSVAYDGLNVTNKALLKDNAVTLVGTADGDRAVSAVADANSTIVAITGEAAFGRGSAAGASIAVNDLVSTTQALIQGGTYSPKDESRAARFDVRSTNTSDIAAVAFGGGVSTEGLFTFAATIALNLGSNDTVAAIEKGANRATLSGVDSVTVTASDNSKRKTGAGELAWTSQGVLGAGVAIAYSDIGGTSVETKKEKLRASLDDTDVTTREGASIEVITGDTSRLTTAGVGIGVATGDSVWNSQGAAAAGVISKTAQATVSGTTVDKKDNEGHLTGSGTAVMTVKSTSTNYIGSGAAGVVGSLGETPITAGIGLAINKIGNDTKVEVSDSELNVGHFASSAISDSEIVGVGIGAAGTFGVFAGAGSFDYNYIASDTTNEIKGSTIESQGNLGVIAQSDDRIGAYAGALAASNQGAALGSSVTYSEITGKTVAGVDASTLSAAGSQTRTVLTRSNIGDENLIDAQMTTGTFSPNKLVNARQLEASKRYETGVVIDASSTHSISSDLFTAGIAYAGAAALTFSENYVSGSTQAYLTATDVNAQAVKTVGQDAFVPDVADGRDVRVRSSDYTNIGTMVIGLAGGQFVGAGATQNTNNSDRTSSVKVGGATAQARKRINASEFEAAAVSKAGMSNFGITGAGSYMGVSIAASFLNDTIKNKAKVLVENADIGFYKNALVSSKNVSFASIGNYGVAGGIYGAAGGVVYGAVDQGSTVLSEIVNATISDHGANDSSSIRITADNFGKSSAVMVAVAVQGLGGTVGLTLVYYDYDAEVGTRVEDSELAAGSIEDLAVDEIYARADGASVAGSAFASSGSNSVAVTVSEKVHAGVINSNLEARNSISIAAQTRRYLRETLANISVAILAVGVNLQENWINKAITQASEQDKDESSDMRARLQKMQEDNVDHTGDFKGLTDETRQGIRERTAVHVWDGSISQNTGVHAVVEGSTVKSTSTDSGSVSVTATERNWVDNTAGSGGAGGVAVVTTLTKNVVGHRTDVVVNDSTLTARNVSVQTLLGDNKKYADGYAEAIAGGQSEDEFNAGSEGIKALSGVGSIGGLAVVPAFATIQDTGTAGVTFANTAVQAHTTTVSAADLSTKRATVGSGTVAAAMVAVLKARVKDELKLGVDLDYTVARTIASSEYFAATAERRTKSTAKVFGISFSAAGYSGALPTVEDLTESYVKLTGSKLTVAGKAANFLAYNAPELITYTDNHGLTVLGGLHSDGDTIASSKALVTFDAGNHFNVTDLAIRSQIGDKKRTLVTGDLESVTVPLGGNYAPDTSDTKTETTSSVTVGEQNYLVVEGESQTHLVLTADSYASHYNHAYMLEFSTFNFSPTGAVRSLVTGNDKVSAKAAGGSVASLDVSAEAHSYADNRVSANGFSLLTLGVSSKGRTDMKSTVSAELAGTWNVTEDVNLRARADESLDAFTRTTKISGVGVSWVESEVKMGATTTATLAEGADITSDRMIVLAENDFALNASGKYEKVLDGISGAFVGGGINLSEVEITGTTKVDIAKNARVLTTRTQAYEAHSISDVRHKAYGTTVEALGGATTRADSVDTYSNIVNVGEGALLKNTGTYEQGGITLAAHEDLKETVDASVDIWTIIGIAPNSRASNKTVRKDQITVAGTIDSARDIALYAGADAYGSLSTTESNTVSETYNHSLIPAGWSTNPIAQLDSNNFVVVTGTGKAVRNINVVADAGVEKGEFRSVSYAWFKGEDDDKTQLEVKGGKSSYTRNANNYLRVDASGGLYAGDKSVVDIKITGLKVPEGRTIDGDYYGYSGEGAYTVTITDEEGNHYTDLESEVVIGTMDYANYLADEWNRIKNLIQAYDQSKSTSEQRTAFAGYQLELQRIEAEMDRLGLMTTETVDNVTYKVPLTKGYSVAYVELPDHITASGGNITVKSDNFYGTGTLVAHGKPSISVDNQSNAYLKVNAMSIGEIGGGIVYRDEVMPDADAGKARVNQLNRNGSYTAAFAKFKTGADLAKSGISIVNENLWGDIPIVHEQEQPAFYKALSTVEIAGSLQGSLTSVSIDNRSGSVVIDSGTADDPVNINGLTIEIKATGDITQGYTDATVNIGYTPESVLDGIQSAAIASTSVSHIPLDNRKDVVNREANVIDPVLAGAETKGRIAGGSVYLAASAININGTIQSGYGTYGVAVGQEALDAAIANSKTGANGKVVAGRMVYKINEGGAVRDSDGSYHYEIATYYDPETGNILTESIETAGGKVYLSGRIMSTGSGKIFAADGGANISIVNNTSTALDVSRITNTNIAGVIEITDTLLNQRTTYTKDASGTTVATRVTDYDAWLKADNDHKADFVSDLGQLSTYTPKTGVRYNWTLGTESSTRTYYKVDKYAFLSIFNIDTESTNWDSDPDTKRTVKPQGTEALPEGAYLDLTASSHAYTLTATNQVMSVTSSTPRTWTEWHFLNKHYIAEWTKTTGTRQIYVSSLVADKTISVAFLGAKNGSIAIESAGDVNLKGDIRNNSALATFSATSSAGSVAQEGSGRIYGNDVRFEARDRIENIAVVSLQNETPVKLQARTFTGDINAKVTGDVTLTHVAAGSDSLALASGGTANVALEATGAIAQSTAGDKNFGVKGARIDIVAGGAVGSITGESLKVNAGQEARGNDTLSASISVKAGGEVSLKQTSGDMRIGTISAVGDVRIEAEGTLIDATPYTGLEEYSKTDELIDKWVANGLIAGPEGNPYLTQLAQKVADYEREVASAFASFVELKGYFEANPNPPEAGPNDDPKVYATLLENYNSRKQQYQNLLPKYGGYDSAQAYLDADETYAKLKDERDNPTYAWTLDQMLFALRSAIVNKETGSTDQEAKSANISGANVTLVAKGIGFDKDEKTEITAEMLKGEDATTYMKMLANADAADVSVEYVRDEAGEIVTNQIPIYKTVDMLDKDGNKIVDHYDEAGNPVYRQQAILDADGKPIVDHYDAGEPLIAKFILGGKSSVGVYATGTLNAVSSGESADQAGAIYLSARNKDAQTQATTLNVGLVETQNASAVRILGKAGVLNANEALDAANVIARSLIVEGGSGTIGELTDAGVVKYFNVQLDEELEVRATGNIYLRSLVEDAPLLIASAYTASKLTLVSNYGIGMAEVYEGVGYINAGSGLELLVDPETGLIGSIGNPLRILVATYPLELAAKEAYVQGVSGTSASSLMRLGEISVVSDLYVTNGAHAIELLGAYDKTVIKRDGDGNPVLDDDGHYIEEVVHKNGRITVAAQNGQATVYGKGDVTISGAVSATGTSEVVLASAEGSLRLNGSASAPELTLSGGNYVIEGDAAAITADTLYLEAGKGINLGSQTAANTFERVEVYGFTPSLDDDFSPVAEIQGNVTIRDSHDRLDAYLYGIVYGNFAIGNVKELAEGDERGDLRLNGNVIVHGDIAAETVTGDILVQPGGVLVADNSISMRTREGNITLAGGLSEQVPQLDPSWVVAGDDITLVTQGATSEISINGTFATNSGDIALKASSVSMKGDIDAGIGMQTDSVSGKINVETTVGMILDGTIDAAGLITLYVTDPDNQASVISVKGEVTSGVTRTGASVSGISNSIAGAGAVYFDGSLRSAGDVTTTIKGGDGLSVVYFNGSVESTQGSIRTSLQQEGTESLIAAGIYFKGDTKAAKDVYATIAKEGHIELLPPEENADTQRIIATEGDIVFTTNQGNVTVNGTMEASGGSIALTTNVGEIVTWGDIDAAGTIVAEAGGMIDLGGKVDAGGRIRLHTRGDYDIYVGSEEYDDDIPDITSGIVHPAFGETGIEAVISGSGVVYFEGDLETTGDIVSTIEKGHALVHGLYVLGSAVSTKAGIDINVEQSLGDEETLGNGAIYIKGATRAFSGIDAKITDAGQIRLSDEGAVISEGDVNLTTGEGDVQIGTSVVASGNIRIRTGEGDINIAEDVLSIEGDVFLSTDAGDVTIGDRLVAMSGSAKVAVGEGDVNIGYVVDELTVYTGTDFDIDVGKGKVTISGATEGGRDVKVAVNALAPGYVAEDSIVFEEHGSIHAEQDAVLTVSNGDLHVTDDVTAGNLFMVNALKKGTVIFDENLASAGSLGAHVDDGGIVVGENVVSTAADILLDVTEGFVTIGKSLRAENGTVSVRIETAKAPDTPYATQYSNYDNEGGIYIGAGQTAEDRAITSRDADLHVGTGRIFVVGKTLSSNDVSVRAGIEEYVPGKDGIVFEQDGEITAGNDAKVFVDNGDVLVTRHVTAGRDISFISTTRGDISFGQTVAAARNLTLGTAEGTVLVNKAVRAIEGDVTITVGDGSRGTGDILLGLENASEYDLDGIGTGSSEYALMAGNDINLKTSDGKIWVFGKTRAGALGIEGQGDLNVKTRYDEYHGEQSISFGQFGKLYVNHDAVITAENGNLLIDDHFVVGNTISANTLVQGNVTFEDIRSGGDVTSRVEAGTIEGRDITSGGTVTLTVSEAGDIVFNDIHAARVELDAADTVEVSTITVAPSGDDARPDLTLAGMTIRVQRIASGEAPFGPVEPVVLLSAAPAQASASNASAISIAFEGSGGDSRPIDTLTVGDIAAQARVRNLWARNADIGVSGSELAVNKAVALERVYVHNGALSLSLFGTTPRRTGDTVILWNNIWRDAPDASLAAWHNGATDRRWVNFVMRSDGYLKSRRGAVVDYGDFTAYDRMSDSVVNMMGVHLTEKLFASTGFVNVRAPVTPAAALTTELAASDEDETKGRITVWN